MAREANREGVAHERPILSKWEIAVAIIALILVWGVPGIIVLTSTRIQVTDAGDVFAIFTALFAAAAIAGISYIVLLQRREFNSTRAQLKTQAESLLLAAQLNALVARITAYDREINDQRADVQRLKTIEEQRLSFYRQIDILLDRAASRQSA